MVLQEAMAMSAPFYKFGAFGDEVSLIVAFVIGIGFGFVLERAGFGNARKLAAQFYLKDLAVLKVMFTAIITAMVGLFLLSVAGFVDLSMIYLVPTYVVPQIVGGLLLGVGFVIGGYCPGTSVVSAGTGRLDGMVYLVGVCVGIFVYGEVYPAIADFTKATGMGQMTLSSFTNIPYGILVFAVVMMAVVAFIFAEIAEKKFGGVEHDEGSLTNLAKKVNFSRGLMGALLALGFVSVFLGSPYGGDKATIDAKEMAMVAGSDLDQLEATDLADRIVQGNIDFMLIDLRGADEYASYHIPTSVNAELSAIDFSLFPRNETIVLYGKDGVQSAQAWFLFKAKGYPSVYMLKDGLESWMNQVLYPSKPANPDADALEAFAKQVEVAKFFGGKARDVGSTAEEVEMVLPDAPVAPAQPIQSTRKKGKREGC